MRSLLDLGLSLINILLSTRLLLVSLGLSKLLLLLLFCGLLISISQDCGQNVLLSDIILDHSLLVLLLLLLLKRLLLRSIHLGSLSIGGLQAELVMLLGLLLLLLGLLLLLLLMLQEGLVGFGLLLFILNLVLEDLLLLLSGSLLLLLRYDLGLLWLLLLLKDLLSWRLGILNCLSVLLWWSSCGSRLWFSLRLRLGRRVRSHWKLSGGLSWLWMLGRLRLWSLVQVGILVKDFIFEVLDARKVSMVDIVKVLRSGRRLVGEIMLVWKCGITVVLRLAFVLLKDGKRVGKVKLWLFHVEVFEGVEHSHLLTVAGALNGLDSLGRIFVAWTEVLNLLVGDQSLFWLLAFLIKDTKIVPDLTLEGVKRGGFDDVLERVAELSIFKVNNSKGSPVSGLSWVFEGCFLKELEGLLVVSFGHVASALDIESVSQTWVQLLAFLSVLKRLIDLAHLEVAPSQMLVDLEAVLVRDQSCLVLTDSLHELLLLLKEQADFNEGVSFSLLGESIGQNGVLEVADGVLDLVGLCEDHSKLV